MAALLLAGPLAAQDERRLESPADLHRDPDGAPLVTLPAGAEVEAGKADGDWRQVTVEGWIYRPSTSPTQRDGFDLVVTSDEGENLRQVPNGPIVGRAREGTLLERVGEKGKWFRVRRDGWVPREAVTQPKQAASRNRARTEPDTTRPAQGRAQARRPAVPPATAAPAAGSAASTIEGVETIKATGLSPMPDSAPAATLSAGTPARVIDRAGEWVRVQLDGWVRESDVKPAEAGVLAGITAAQVRATPDRFVGQTLDWRLQIIAVQVADELRPEIARGQPYLLTRGPLPEPGFVYVTIPPERINEFRSVPPLQEMVLRVTLKAARTRYLNTPVADLVSSLGGATGGQ